ncbi:MAG: hypothetical protein AB7G40_18695, partial [Hyphomonadaceae bacterium]
MSEAASDIESVDAALQEWRQGDLVLENAPALVHLADLRKPLTVEATATASEEGLDAEDYAVGAVFSEVRGLVVLTQSCDIVRSCKQRPFVEVAALVELTPDQYRLVEKNRMPSFACIPRLADQRLAVHLDRSMTIEKAVLADCVRVAGLEGDDQVRAFSDALARKRSRFAFPTDFILGLTALRKRLTERHSKNSVEGAHIRALREIRVRAAPSWTAAAVFLTLWFVIDGDPIGHPASWGDVVEEWASLIKLDG